MADEHDEFNVCEKKEEINITFQEPDFKTRTLSPKYIKSELGLYFNEINLGDLVCDYVGNPFISSWVVTDKKMNILLPLENTGRYDFMVDWGDGESHHILTCDQPEVTHVYSEPGVYLLKMTGIIQGFSFGCNSSKWRTHPSSDQIIDISQWGCLSIGNKGKQFYYCSRLNISAVDTPNLHNITDLSNMFVGALCFNGDVGKWSTSRVTDMSYMFAQTAVFNGDVSALDTRSVTSFKGMFFQASAFNGDVSKWVTSSVLDTSFMFNEATAFSGDVSRWDVSQVTNMRMMFRGAVAFTGKEDTLRAWTSPATRDAVESVEAVIPITKTQCCCLMLCLCFNKQYIF